MCVFLSAASFAASEIQITDNDNGELYNQANLEIGFTNERGTIARLFCQGNGGYGVAPIEPAAPPTVDMFENLLSDMDGPVEVTVYWRGTLTIYTDPKDVNASNWYCEDGGELGETLRLYNFYGFSPERSSPKQDMFAGVTQIVAVDVNGEIQTIAVESIKNYNNDIYTLKNTSSEQTWKPSDFPLTFYAVSYGFIEHDITVTQADNGTIFTTSADGTTSPIGDDGVVAVNLGADQTFTVVPDDGYQVARLIVDGEEITPENKIVASYTFTGVREDGHTFSAVFEPYSAASVDGGSGVIASVNSMTDSESNPTVAAFEALGFTDGSRVVNIVSADGTETGGTFAADGFVQAVTVHISYEEGNGSGALTFSIPAPEGGFDAEKNYYVIALNRTTNYYDLWEAVPASDRSLNTAGGTVSAYFGSLNVTVEPASAYAPETTFFVYSGTATVTEETPDTPPAGTGGGGASGSGCSAGLSSLALLAFAPLLALRRRP